MKYNLEPKIIEDNVCVIYDNYMPDEIVAGGRIMLDLHNINQPIDCFIESISKVNITEAGIEVYISIRYQEINAITHKEIDNVVAFERKKINHGINKND